jgi:hypothetical protein
MYKVDNAYESNKTIGNMLSKIYLTENVSFKLISY